MNIYRVGATATLNLAIINQVETTLVQEQVGFGEGLGEVIEKHIKKIIVFGGSPINMMNPISEDVVRKGMAIREAKIEEGKERALKNANGGGMTTGFGANPQGQAGGFGAGTNTNTNGGFGVGTATNTNGGFGVPNPTNGGFGVGAPVNTNGGFGIPTA